MLDPINPENLPEHNKKKKTSALQQFLKDNQKEILDMTEKKTLDLAGAGPSSEQLKLGLPLFYKQLLDVLVLVQDPNAASKEDKAGMEKGANEANEEAIAHAGNRPDEAEVAKAASLHGTELLRLGYTLSHVVHAYGAMCQSITELAITKKEGITAEDFHALNRCLDVAIAGAVTGFELQKSLQESTREIQHLGALAHELRNAMSSVSLTLQLIKRGTVGFAGSTGKIMEDGLKRIETIIDRSLTEVRMRMDPELHFETGNFLKIVDELLLTAGVEAQKKNQIINVQVDPELVIEADQQLFYSAFSNLIQNAIKFSKNGSKIQVRGKEVNDQIIVEIEDECGGLPGDKANLFEAFEQQDVNKTGLGLGLTIAKRAIELNHGTISAYNLPQRGCIFTIKLPKYNIPKNIH